jgi:cell division protein FtsN
MSWAEFLNRVRAALAAGAENVTAAAPVAPAVLNTPTASAASAASVASFRVVAGSFAKRANAEAQVRRLKLKGFDSFITENRG